MVTIINVLFSIMLVFLAFREAHNRRKIRELKDNLEKTARIEAQKETRDILMGIFEGKNKNHRVSDLVELCYGDYLAKAEAALGKHIILRAREAIDRKADLVIEDHIKKALNTTILKIEHREFEYLNNLPSEIQQARRDIGRADAEYGELKRLINSPEFIQQIISKMNALQLHPGVKGSEEGE